MRKIFSILAVAALMLTAVQTAQAQTYSATTDVTVTARDAVTGAPVLEPVEMFLMVHNGTAVVSYNDVNGVHEYVGKAYQAEEGSIVFAGLNVKMPAGDCLTFCFAEPTEGRFEITAHYAGERLRENNAITLPFIPHNVPESPEA